MTQPYIIHDFGSVSGVTQGGGLQSPMDEDGTFKAS